MFRSRDGISVTVPLFLGLTGHSLDTHAYTADSLQKQNYFSNQTLLDSTQPNSLYILHYCVPDTANSINEQLFFMSDFSLL